jgi:hypothetical protein
LLAEVPDLTPTIRRKSLRKPRGVPPGLDDLSFEAFRERLYGLLEELPESSLVARGC